MPKERLWPKQLKRKTFWEKERIFDFRGEQSTIGKLIERKIAL